MESPWVLRLDGEWDFKFLPNPLLEPEDIDWQGIRIPSNWELHGYGTPQYLNIDYPLNHDIKNPPAIDPEDNPTGYYRKTFQIPSEWEERLPHTALRFEGIRSAAWIWVNGEEVGYTQNTYSPAEFIIGRRLRMGNNQITAKVIKHCAGTYLEDQDMWRLGGIIRPVSLIAAPDGGIFDIFVRCSFDSDFVNADLNVTITLDEPLLPNSEKRFVRWYLYESSGTDLAALCPLTPVKYQAGKRAVLETSSSVVSPRKWSADEPNLYNLVCELSDEDGSVLDTRAITWGFRQVSIDSGAKFGVLKVNGQPVKLRGVNRHDFHPRFGQAVPREVIESDLILMKRNNINAIRCSHYPNQTALYETADRLGLYVVDEANMESHGLRRTLPASKPIWRRNCVDRVERMVLCHRNHPCVIMWSLGNEAGQGRNIKEMKKSALALDPTRPIHYEGDHKLECSDVFSLMYPRAEAVSRAGKGKAALWAGIGEKNRPHLFWPHRYRRRPVILCDFAHAMGNSMGGFSDYMREINRFPNIAGAFIWDFADQALYRFSNEGQGYLAYGGDFGDFPNDGIFCANGIFSGDRRAKPMLEEVKTLYAPVSIRPANIERGMVVLRNRHSHKDLSDYQIDWVLERGGIAQGEGSLRKPDLGPGEERRVNLFRSIAEYPGEGEGYLSFFVRLLKENDWAPAGHLVARLQFPVPMHQGDAAASDLIFEHLKLERPKKTAKASAETQKKGTLGRWRHERQGERFLIAGSKLGAIINVKDGSLETLDFGKGNILVAPLQPDFFRALTDNESSGTLASRGLRGREAGEGIWESAGRRRRLRSWKFRVLADGLEVTLIFRIRGFVGKFTWKLLFGNDGRVLVSMRGLPGREMLRFGSRMIIPARYSRVSWYGLGPQECYVDRKAGAVVGLHEAEVEKLGYDYLKPQENGNRTEVRRVAFSDGGSAIVFTASEDGKIDFSAGFASREAIASAAHAHEIVRDSDIHVNIDGGQRGVGGCRPGVLDLKARYKMRPFHFRTLTYTIGRETPGAAEMASNGARR